MQSCVLYAVQSPGLIALSPSEFVHSSSGLFSSLSKSENGIFSLLGSCLPWKTTRILKSAQSKSRAAAVLDVIMPEGHDGKHLKTVEELCNLPENMAMLVQTMWYMLSNNIRLSNLQDLFVKVGDHMVSGEDVFVMRILQSAGLDNLQSFRGLLSLKRATAEALVEALFKSAIRSYDIRVIQLMLQAGMKPIPILDEARGDIITPLDFLVSFHLTDMAFQIIKLLIFYKLAYCPRSWKDKALSSAVKYQHEELVRLLISSGADAGSLDLSDLKFYSHARLQPNYTIFKTIMGAGTDIELRNGGRTPLGNNYGNASFTLMLLTLGADVNASQPTTFLRPGFGKETKGFESNALALASQMGNTSVMRILLEAGAMVNEDENCHRFIPPLVLAVENKHKEVTALLLDAGADIHIGNNFSTLDEKPGRTLFDRAGSDAELHQILRKSGLQPSLQMIQDDLGADMLEFAKNGDIGSVAWLLGSDLWTYGGTSKYCSLAFSAAVEHGDGDLVSLLLSFQITEVEKIISIGNLRVAVLLYDFGILSEIIQHNGRHILVHAIIKRHDHLVDFLLSHGADQSGGWKSSTFPESRKHGCQTPLEATLCVGWGTLAQLLLRRGASFAEAELNAVVWAALVTGEYGLCFELRDVISSFARTAPTAFAMTIQARNYILFNFLLENGIAPKGQSFLLLSKEDSWAPLPLAIVYDQKMLGWWNLKRHYSGRPFN